MNHTFTHIADGLSEGLTADTEEKGGRPMSDSQLSSLRHEVRDYLRSCEHLISVAMTPGNTSFSQDEREILVYYAAEVAKILAPQGEPQ